MLLMLLLAAGTMVGHAQTNCFTYYDYDATIITGLTDLGTAAVGISEADDGEWYTLQGFKLGKRPNVPGVYIHKGKTVVIKNVP